MEDIIQITIGNVYMSMNLIFNIKKSENWKGGCHCIEFPYQTSTDTTYAVLAAKTIKDRMKLIEKDLSHMDDKEYKDLILEEVKYLMEDESLELSLI